MSYKEAMEDGILIEHDDMGIERYLPPCNICGTPVRVYSYSRGTDYLCPDCKRVLAIEVAKHKRESSESKKRDKLKAAIKRIAKVADIEEYEEAIQAVGAVLNNPGWFQSTEEIMVGIELVHNHLAPLHQVEVNSYKVDFVIPKLKVALEVDGEPYHRKEDEEKQIMRNIIISENLGGYEVIHVMTEDINADVTKLVKTIKSTLAVRKKLREEDLTP